MTQMKLSNRAAASIAVTSPLNRILGETIPLLRHPIHNPKGALNLGIAHNDLMAAEMFEKSKECLDITLEDSNYGEPNGSVELRTAMTNIINKHFKTHTPVLPEHIFTHTGATASIYHMIMTIADPGDYVMIQAPYYGAFDKDICVDSGVNIYPFHNPKTEELSVSLDFLESTYSEAVAAGKKITAIIITNPSNPLGRCYTLQDIHTFLKFAKNHSLHAVFDEIYALSTFGHLLPCADNKENPFISVMSLANLQDLIDPAYVHVLYGLSKDFNINGYRVGFIIDQHNPPLRRALGRNNVFSYMSTVLDRMLVNMLSDHDWVENFLAVNQKRLAENYQKTISFLDENALEYIPSEAGSFLLLNLASRFEKVHQRQMTFEDEDVLRKQMISNGVYIVPGLAFHCPQPGYFRLTFALTWEELEAGLLLVLKTLYLE